MSKFPYTEVSFILLSTFKKDPGRAGQKSLATAGTNFTKPGTHNKGDLCILNETEREAERKGAS